MDPSSAHHKAPRPALPKTAAIALLVVWLLLSLIPVWSASRFPSQDGPSHLYNAALLLELGQADRPTQNQFFQRNLTPFPDWASHLALASLMGVFSPAVAEQVLVSLCLLLLALSFWYCQRALGRPLGPALGIAVLLSSNLLLHMGFYSFTLGMQAGLWTLGVFLRFHPQWSGKRICILYALLGLTYFCHFLPFVLCLCVMAGLAGLGSLQAFWSARRATPTTDPFKAPALRQQLAGLLLLVPGLLVAEGWWMYSAADAQESFFAPMADLFSYLVTGRLIVVLTEQHAALGLVFVLFLLGLLAWNLICRIRKRLAWDAPVGLAALACLILYLVAPWATANGTFISPRLLWWALLILLLWLAPLPRRIEQGALLLITGLLIWQCALRCYEYRSLAPEIEEVVALGSHLDTEGTLGPRIKTGKESPSLGTLSQVEVFRHLPALLCLGRDWVNLDNVEADFHHNPIVWREPFQDRGLRFDIAPGAILALGKESAAWARRFYAPGYVELAGSAWSVLLQKRPDPGPPPAQE